MPDKLMNIFLNLLYPNTCPRCQEFLPASQMVCDSCAEKMLLEQDAYCHQCGKINCLCYKRSFAYDKAVVACHYDEITAPAVLELKLSRNTNFAYFSARILAERLQHGSYYQLNQIHCVMPVPMTHAKQRRRGYNQAALIAKELANLLHLPYRENVLQKNKSSVEQHTLTSKERAKNAENFSIQPVSLENTGVLLCDDVLTTGNTLHYCADLLKQQKAAYVIAAAAASTVYKIKNQEEDFTS